MSSRQPANYVLKAELPYLTEQFEGWWMAKCDILNIASQGKTKRSAIKNLKDSIALKIQDALETDNLESLLSGYGFHPVKIGDKTFWGAESVNDASERLEVRANLSVRAPKRDFPHIREEHIPNKLPWVIGGHFSTSPRRPRAA